MTKMFIVEVQETDKEYPDFNEWHKVPLEMCTRKRNCGCYKERGDAGLANCSNCFYETFDEQTAKDAFEEALNKSQVARIRKVKEDE